MLKEALYDLLYLSLTGCSEISCGLNGVHNRRTTDKKLMFPYERLQYGLNFVMRTKEKKGEEEDYYD